MDFFTALGAIGSTITLAEASKNINSKTKMVLNRLFKGEMKIGIFGAGGTGKTTLAYLLSGKLDELSLQYSETPNDEKVKIGKNVMGVYWVAPGQEERISTDWPKMFREITNSSITGIINVVSFGYHATDPRIPWTELDKYYQKGQTKEQFIASFISKRQAMEERFMKELVPRIKDSAKRIWMITLVTKQDLWWENKIAVKNHYLDGVYNEYIKEIKKQKGNENFRHDYLSCSLVINSLRIGKEVFKKNTEGYDVPLQNANLLALLNKIETCLR